MIENIRDSGTKKVMEFLYVKDSDNGTYLCKEALKKNPHVEKFELYVGSNKICVCHITNHNILEETTHAI